MKSKKTDKRQSILERLLRSMGFVPEQQAPKAPTCTPSQDFINRTVEKFKSQMQPGGRWGGSKEIHCSQPCLLSPIDYDLYVNKSLVLDFDRLSDYAKHLDPEDIGTLKQDLGKLLLTPLGRSGVDELKDYHKKPLGLALKEQFPELAKKMLEAGIFPDHL